MELEYLLKADLLTVLIGLEFTVSQLIHDIPSEVVSNQIQAQSCRQSLLSRGTPAHWRSLREV